MSTLKTGFILIPLVGPILALQATMSLYNILTTGVTFAVVAFAVVVLITGDFGSVWFYYLFITSGIMFSTLNNFTILRNPF